MTYTYHRSSKMANGKDQALLLAWYLAILPYRLDLQSGSTISSLSMLITRSLLNLPAGQTDPTSPLGEGL